MAEKWEYLHFEAWSDKLIVTTLPDGKELSEAQLWTLFNQLGDEGWDMIAATSILSLQKGSLGSFDYETYIHYVFKRRKS